MLGVAANTALQRDVHNLDGADDCARSPPSMTSTLGYVAGVCAKKTTIFIHSLHSRACAYFFFFLQAALTTSPKRS